MTQQEFESFVKEQKDGGKSEEEILVIFAKMFQDGQLERQQFEAIVEALGYEISDEFRELPDDEFKEKVLVKGEEAEGEGEADTVDEGGEEPPAADDKPESETEEEEESEDEESESEEEEEDEESKAMRLMNLKK